MIEIKPKREPMVEIKPCPFCGSIDGLSIDAQLDSGFPTRHAITTISCGCGCSFVTESYRPIEAWNKRYYEEKE